VRKVIMLVVEAASALTIFRSARRSSRESVHFIKRVTRWSSSDDGEIIQLETVASDGSQVILQMAYRYAPRFVQATIQAASIAEQIQTRMPGQGLEMTCPYMATNVWTAVSIDGKSVGLGFQTTDGVPVLVSLTREVARKAIAQLSEQLVRLETKPLPKLS
jgi:hypothetical protein